MKLLHFSILTLMLTLALGANLVLAEELQPPTAEADEQLPETEPATTDDEDAPDTVEQDTTSQRDEIERRRTPSSAQSDNGLVGYLPQQEIKRSSRDYFLSIKFGTYKPEHLRAIWDNDTPNDDSDDVAVEYSEIYPDKEQFFGLLDAAWTPITKYTTLGIGGGFGFSYAEGEALREGYGGFEKTDNRVIFILVPLHVSLFWNLQFWENQPVIPGVSVGYDAWFWNEDKDQGEGDGNGFRQGWHVAGSLWLLLDWLEPEHAYRLDHDYGINHTYLVGEYRYSAINGFGNRGFDFTDQTITGGLGFAF